MSPCPALRQPLPPRPAFDLPGARSVQAVVFATTAALASLATGPAQALSPAEVFAQVSPSVWRVQTFDADGQLLGQGSGVVVAPERVVTNCHVLAKARKVQVRREASSGPGLPARLVLWDPPRDLCQLQVPGLVAPAVVRQASSTVAVGQTAYAIGHPRNLDLTMSAGLVSSLRRNNQQQLLLVQTSAAISGGSSGGGLFNEQGELVGLTTMGLFSAVTQNLNFAIPADWIADLPRRHAAEQARQAAAAPRPPPSAPVLQPPPPPPVPVPDQAVPRPPSGAATR